MCAWLALQMTVEQLPCWPAAMVPVMTMFCVTPLPVPAAGAPVSE